MLQSIQYNGSGPPTYVYSKKAVGATMEYYQVFATETREYDGKENSKYTNSHTDEEVIEQEGIEHEEFKVLDNAKTESIQEAYEKEYRRRESFLWKLR